MTPAAIRVGIGGWTFAPWRGVFYPEGLPHDHELAYASAHLTTIEINGTFYRHQTPGTFAAWRSGTPDGFVFSVKAHRATTHGRDMTAAGASVARFLASGLEELGPKLGPILWQFPPTRQFDAGDFERFLGVLPPTLNGRKLRHAVEARHASFENPAWVDLARAHNVAIAIIDSSKQALRGDITADFVYARLQRNDSDAVEGYGSPALDGWAVRAQSWAGGRNVTDLPLTASPSTLPGPLPCFLYFISGDKHRAPHAATALLSRLGAN